MAEHDNPRQWGATKWPPEDVVRADIKSGDNYVMQNLLKKCGFTYCGIIHVGQDDDPRMAFEKV